MSQPFLAEIRIWACNFAPRGWAFCSGQLMAISQNTALFSLIGTYYGGDGRVTFGLPNLMGRSAVDQGTGPGLTTRDLGEEGGEASVTLLTSEMPTHSHAISAAIQGAGSGSAEETNTPSNEAWLGRSFPGSIYTTGTPNTNFAPYAIGMAGGSLPHENMQPYQVMNFCIALSGIYPARN